MNEWGRLIDKCGLNAKVGKSSFHRHQVGIINGCMVIRCFLTDCLLVSRENKNQ